MDDAGRRVSIRLAPRQFRTIAISAIIVVVGTTAVVAITARYRREQRADTLAASSDTTPTTTRSPAPSEPEAVAALGPTFAADLRVRPAAEAGQSKLWAHDGRWWGVLLVNAEYRIHAFDPATGWHDTGTLVDPRASAHPDVLAEGGQLIVASAGRSESERNALEVRRFTYDSDERVYRLDSGYPVRVTPLGVDHVTVARSATGTLWAAFVSAQRVQVAHTIGGDGHWSSPAQIPVAEAALPSAAVAIAASDDTVAVLWASAAGTFHVATTTDGESWSARQLMGGAAPDVDRTVVLRATSGSGRPRFVGLFTVEPSREEDGNALASHIVAVAASDKGDWSTYAVSRVEDHLEDPTIVVDEGDSSILVLAAAEGSVWMKRASIGDLAFSTGRGTQLIPTDLGGLFADVTSARAIPAGAGFVALASDGGAGRYAYAMRGVAARAASSPGEVASGDVVADTFDGRPADAGPPEGWSVDTDGGTGALDVATGLVENGLRLRSTSPIGGSRACRRFTLGTATSVVASAAFRITGGGTGDATVLSVRGGGESATVRIDDRGRPSFFDGAEKRVGDRAIDPAAWYRAEVDIDVAARRYSVRVLDASGAVLTRADALAWRSARATAPNELCVATRDGEGSELTVDDVTVRRLG